MVEMKKVQRKKKGSMIFLVLISVLYILPLVVTFTNSFMSQVEISRNYSAIGDILHSGTKFVNMKFIPEKATFSQYKELLLESPIYLNMFWNSVKLALPVVVGHLVVSSMAAYAFSVLSFKEKSFCFLYIF